MLSLFSQTFLIWLNYLTNAAYSHTPQLKYHPHGIRLKVNRPQVQLIVQQILPHLVYFNSKSSKSLIALWFKTIAGSRKDSLLDLFHNLIVHSMKLVA